MSLLVQDPLFLLYAICVWTITFAAIALVGKYLRLRGEPWTKEDGGRAYDTVQILIAVTLIPIIFLWLFATPVLFGNTTSGALDSSDILVGLIISVLLSCPAIRIVWSPPEQQH